jgi:hypothetical protein
VVRLCFLSATSLSLFPTLKRWKTADLLCLNRLNAALDEWHSEEVIKCVV